MLKRAEPPICVGLYARWGAGKTFMISLLKREFDETVREDPHTGQLLQFFEEGYAKLKPTSFLKSKKEDPNFWITCIFGRIIPSIIPYWITTFRSIICDAFYASEASRKAWECYSKLKRSCKPKAKTTDIGGTFCGKDTFPCLACMGGIYNRLSGVEDQEQVEEEKIEREFIFVNFNAWECAVCLSSVNVCLSSAQCPG